MLNIVLGNVVSLLAQFVDILAGYKFNDKRRNLLANFLSSGLSILSKLILFSFAGVVNGLITELRLGAIYLKDEKEVSWIKWTFPVFVCLYATTFFNYEGVSTIFLFICSMTSFIPKWFSKNMNVIRTGALCSNVSILIYHLCIFDFVSSVFNIINIVSLSISLRKWIRAQ